MRRALTWLAAVLAGPAVAVAQEYGYDHGRVRHADTGVTLQRATETSAEEASANAPFFPGDRVWTDGSGRAEFQFPGGSVARLDSRSKLDYLSHDVESRDETVALRLWSGSLILRVEDGRDAPRFEIEAPGGLLNVSGRGVFRLDAEAGETRLRVYEGEAVLDAGRRRVTVEEGEEVVLRRGDESLDPRGFDRRDLDDFGYWDQERSEGYGRNARSARYLPAEVTPYASEFDTYGSWHYETEVGNVWAPTVQVGWRPYTNGRWAWTAYGWTWVPYEPWGWAVSHYGRWGFSVGLGWYWVPGRVWGPGWVSWAVGGDYVGWCPLGYRDRPVVPYGYRGSYGHGGRYGQGGGGHGPGWSFSRRGDLSARDFAKRRIDESAVQMAGLRVADSANSRPSRDLRSLETTPATAVTARPRGSFRENRGEGMAAPSSTSIPEAARRRGAGEPGVNSGLGRPESTPREGQAWRTRPRSEERVERQERPEGTLGGGVSRRPSPLVQPLPAEPTRERGDEDRRRERGRATPPREESPREATPREGARPRTREPDRDPMRQLFQPLTEPRASAPRGSEGGARPRAERPEPRSSGESARPERVRPDNGGSRANPPPRRESRPADNRGSGGNAERRKPPR